MSEVEHVDVHRVGEGVNKILLVHGSGSASRAILGLGRLIAERVPDCEVVAPSLAGYGSTAADESQNIIEQHLDVMGQVMGADIWHIVGHSMGGYLGLQMARRVPNRVASVCAIEPICFGALDAERDADALEADRKVIRAFQDGMENGTGISHFISAWNQSNWNDLPQTVREQLEGMAAIIHEEAVVVSFDDTPASAYAEPGVPIAVLGGAETLLPAHRIVQRLSEQPFISSSHWVAGARHMDAVRMPQAFAALIAEHILECIATR